MSNESNWLIKSKTINEIFPGTFIEALEKAMHILVTETGWPNNVDFPYKSCVVSATISSQKYLPQKYCESCGHPSEIIAVECDIYTLTLQSPNKEENRR